MTFNVGSEIGPLRQVIVHRPGLELSRLTPDNIESLLFDDVLWASKAKEEHDAFAEALRGQGRRRPLLRPAARRCRLPYPPGGAFVLDRLCTPQILGPSLVGPVRSLFEEQDAKALAGALIGGVLKADLHPLHARSLKLGHAQGRRLRPRSAAQPPFPARQLLLDIRRRERQPHG